MPYVHEVEIYPPPGERPPNTASRAIFGPFNEAIRFGLAWAGSIPGPFNKYAIRLHPISSALPPSVSLPVENVAVADLGADIDAIERMPEEEARAAIAALVIEALDLFRARLPWDDEPVRSVVRAAGIHRGPYTFESRRLTTRDRSTGCTYATVYEFSGPGTRILAVRRDPDGCESNRTVVMSHESHGPDYIFDPETGRTFVHARSAIVKDGRLYYRNRERQVITSVPLSAFDR